MARQSGAGDPAAKKYQSTFEAFVQKIAAVPKEAADELEAQRLKRPSRKRRKVAKVKKP